MDSLASRSLVFSAIGPVDGSAVAEADPMPAINAARALAGAPPFVRDARLDKAAQSHAADLAAGRARPHDGLIRRIKDSGFPVFSLDDPHISFGNYSEGVFPGGVEWREAILDLLVTEKGRETHGGDFREPKFDAIGVGIAGKWLVFDYGATRPVDFGPLIG